jgi:hypothetical protein
VPYLDFMVLCDHVRPEGGLMHLLAAGIDRVMPPRLPALQTIGIAGRIGFTPGEASSGRQFEIEVEVRGPDGDRLAGVRGSVGIDSPVVVDSRLPSLGGIALNLLVPLQAEGVHTVELAVDGELIKSIPFVVQVTPDPPELAREQGA